MIYKFSNILTVTFGILFSASLLAQDYTLNVSLLREADSLFTNKKYTEALTSYQAVYDQDKATPAMLLKMAFIHEGLDQTVESLYFLNQYYQLTADREAITKINELAKAHQLSGYEYSDGEYLLGYYRKYQTMILGTISALLLLSTVLVWRRKQHQETWVPAFVFQIIVAGLLLTFSNQWMESQKAIIKTNNTVLMNGPAAGAEPITIITKGHRVEVLERNTIWTKINWNNRVGYVRNNRILLI